MYTYFSYVVFCLPSLSVFMYTLLCTFIVYMRMCMCVCVSVPDFSILGEYSEDRLTEYIPTITYEAESPDEAALVEVMNKYGYTVCILFGSSTVEPPNNGHVGDEHFVHCSEVVPSSEVEMYGQLIWQGASSLFIVGRLSSYWSGHYRRFYCIYILQKCIFTSTVYTVCVQFV